MVVCGHGQRVRNRIDLFREGKSYARSNEGFGSFIGSDFAALVADVARALTLSERAIAFGAKSTCMTLP